MASPDIKVGVLGGSGQVGTELVRQLASEELSFCAPAHADVDISDERSISNWLQQENPEVVINCAGFTDVAASEQHVSAAEAANVLGPGILGTCCRERSIRVVHVSTDYVFDGRSDRPYLETDSANPLSAYALTKYQGERALMRSGANCCVLRAGWIFGRARSSFVSKILRAAVTGQPLRVVADQVGTPCSASSVAAALRHVASLPFDQPEVYHMASTPHVSWYEFAIEIVDQAVLIGLLREPVAVKRETAASYAPYPRRPAYSVLDSAKLERTGWVKSDWRVDLRRLLGEATNQGELEWMQP